MIAVAYIRVSTTEQDFGPEAQRNDIQAWCEKNKYTLAAEHIFEDRLSGATLPEDSPALLAAFEACKTTGATVLVIQKRDRLHRDKMRLALIEHFLDKQGVKIISAAGEGNGDSPEDFLVRGIMDLFAQYERMVIKFRTKKALAVKRSRGEQLGGLCPFGYDSHVNGGGKKMLVPNEQEQLWIRSMVLARTAGQTLQQIANGLMREGIKTKCGTKTWTPTGVRVCIERYKKEQVTK